VGGGRSELLERDDGGRGGSVVAETPLGPSTLGVAIEEWVLVTRSGGATGRPGYGSAVGAKGIKNLKNKEGGKRATALHNSLLSRALDSISYIGRSKKGLGKGRKYYQRPCEGERDYDGSGGIGRFQYLQSSQVALPTMYDGLSATGPARSRERNKSNKDQEREGELESSMGAFFAARNVR